MLRVIAAYVSRCAIGIRPLEGTYATAITSKRIGVGGGSSVTMSESVLAAASFTITAPMISTVVQIAWRICGEVNEVCDGIFVCSDQPGWRCGVAGSGRLPENSGRYIVTACDEGCSYGEGIWYDAVVVVAEYCDGEWTWDDDGVGYYIDDFVVCWMPLPEPPKGD